MYVQRTDKDKPSSSELEDRNTYILACTISERD